MYYKGSFINQQGHEIAVHIVTGGDASDTVEIGEGALLFTDDPVEITGEFNDSFDVLLSQSATIRLLTRGFVGDFYGSSCHDTAVNILRDGELIFAGYIEPQLYTQPFNEYYDELELNCIDVLSALQYSNYKDIGTDGGPTYASAVAASGQRPFYTLLSEIIQGATAGLDLLNGKSPTILYDGSRARNNATGTNRYGIFHSTAINDLLFMGDDEGGVWTQQEVLAEILRYLNLHIVQDGLTFRIFSWDSVRSSESIQWRVPNGTTGTAPKRQTITLTDGLAADVNTTIDLPEVYNRLELTCDVREIEALVESPLDSDALESPYPSKMLYCTEYSADGEGERAYRAFMAMTHGTAKAPGYYVYDGTSYNYDPSEASDWYIRLRNNPAWKFNSSAVSDLIASKTGGSHLQNEIPDHLATKLGAALIAMGRAERQGAQDNSPVSKVNMTDYLVIGVNGNENDTEAGAAPDADDIKAAIPCAEYVSNSGGGAFSPVDDATTNYIVISGSLILNPVMNTTAKYSEVNTVGYLDAGTGTTRPFWHNTVPSRNNDDGRYYTRRYYAGDLSTGLVPFSDKGPQLYDFKYSAIGDATDTISKVSVLACMLVIGDKCVVETGTDGQPSDFEWRTFKERKDCADDDEYYSQCFTIGFDPKIDDPLVGAEFDIQNNIDHTLNIDAEGIAIPIKRSDKISGDVRFYILGPVNVLWDVITRKHPTFFRHTSWKTTSVPLLSHISNILVKDFEVKVYSDNAKLDTDQGNDIVYISDTEEKFFSPKEDLTFKICSALTSAECAKLGVANKLYLSTPVDTYTGQALTSVYDYNSEASVKPEQLYVDAYYREYHRPRIMLNQSITVADTVSRFDHYIHPALGREFYIQAMSRNLMEDCAELILKEVTND